MPPTCSIDTNSAHDYGLGSPLERLLALDGQVLLLGAPLDSLTGIRYAEAMARIGHKRRVAYQMTLLDGDSHKVAACGGFRDSNGIPACFADEEEMDAVETIARLYVSEGRALEGRVRLARCFLIDANDIVAYAVRSNVCLVARPGHES